MFSKLTSKKALLNYLFIIPILLFSCQEPGKKRILVFSKTAGFRHESIKEGKLALIKLGQENNFQVDTTEAASIFTENNLKNYSAVVFLSTTGDVLNYKEQLAFERYIQAGGGFVGIHAASDTEYEWPWYVKLVGGNFASHPDQQDAMIHVVDKNHSSTEFLPATWKRFDEWYNLKNINPSVKILANLDEKTYKGGEMGENHPIAWHHEFEGGKAFYTALGHTKESYSEPLFLKHILGGINYSIGSNKRDYSKAKSPLVPEESRFNKIVIGDNLNEPMELAIANNGGVYYTERGGDIFYVNPQTNEIEKVGSIKVETKYGNGLVGIALDPQFHINQFIYLFDTEPAFKHTVTRFKLKQNKLDLSSARVILEIPIELEASAHTGGSLAFDPQGNLLISVGDNTTPFESSGYAPIDERSGRIGFDAQRSSGNTHDLRGKVLRIHPLSDGTYSIPEGNLFPKDGSKGRPEIYTMGCRNPYRISVDPKTSWVYWGDVGPDAGQDSTLGPRGYDEINQARRSGNHGWPYFIGDNKAYPDYDFATNAIGAKFDPERPVNTSPNNTGAKVLPPAVKPLIWYSYVESNDFPELGKGGRTAMAGPFYYYNQYPSSSKVKFPNYYDNSFIVYEWMRDWINVVRLDDKGYVKKVEPLFTNIKFDHPVDMAFAPDGSLYVLEYGTIWYSRNKNARISKIIFNQDPNRTPTAHITTHDTIGPVPLKVKFLATKSFDLDGDELVYEWRFTGKKIESREKNPEFLFTKPGIYYPSLTVTDIHGKSSTTNVRVLVGNHFPEVSWKIKGNQTFYWNNMPIEYEVKVFDKEDKKIDFTRAKIYADFLPEGKDVYPMMLGHQEAPKKASMDDHKLIAGSDCKACHTIEQKSVGPSFLDVAKKYQNDPSAITKLANKIIKGGAGAWGEHAMSAHPQIKQDEAEEMVKYILGLSNDKTSKVNLPPSGIFIPATHKGKGDDGAYYFTALYKDMGAVGIEALSSHKTIKLRSPKIKAINFDQKHNCAIINSNNNDYHYLGAIKHGSYFVFDQIDVTELSKVTFMVNSKAAEGEIEIHSGAIDGPLLSTTNIKASGKWEIWEFPTSSIKPTVGMHNLYIIFKNRNPKNEDMININWIYFEQ